MSPPKGGHFRAPLVPGGKVGKKGGSPDGGGNTPESKVIWSRRISWEEQYQDSTTAQLPGLRYVHERCRHKAGYKYGREKRHMCHWRDINKPPTRKGLIAAGGI